VIGYRSTKDFSLEWKERLTKEEREAYNKKAIEESLDITKQKIDNLYRAIQGINHIEGIMEVLLRQYGFETFFAAVKVDKKTLEPVIFTRGECMKPFEEKFSSTRLFKNFVNNIASINKDFGNRKKYRTV
jgi:hypothetical protein